MKKQFKLLLTEATDGKVELSDDFYTKVEALIESAVSVKATAKALTLNESTEANIVTLTEAHSAEIDALKEAHIIDLKESTDALKETLTPFLKNALREWAEVNAPALESQTKSRVNESLFGEMRDLLENYNINLDDKATTLVESLEGEVNSLKTQLNEKEKTVITLNEAVQSNKRETVLASVLNECDLADTQKERINEQVADMTYTDDASFKIKVETLIECIQGETGKSEDEPTKKMNLNESVEDPAAGGKSDNTGMSAIERAML